MIMRRVVRKFYKQLKNAIKEYRFKRSVLEWVVAKWSDKNVQSFVYHDYLSLYRLKGITTDEYYDFEFERMDNSFRNSFLGMNEQRHYLDVLNPIRYCAFARNKYAAHKMFENTSIRSSNLYCYYEPYANVRDSEHIGSTIADVVRILRQKNVNECVIKATDESHGDNVLVVNHIDYFVDDCELELYNGERCRISNILSTKPRIIESVIKQTHQFASFNATSVNTIRFMTTLFPSGEARVIAAILKIGRNGACVDNAGSGGNIDASVDLETGEINNVMQYDGWRNIHAIDLHPDTGVKLNGILIDNWDKIKAEVIKYQQSFPWCKAAGWDIAITDDGPIVVEVNDFWDRTLQYFIKKGWRNEIRECYNEWCKTDYEYFAYRGTGNLTSEHISRIVSQNL